MLFRSQVDEHDVGSGLDARLLTSRAGSTKKVAVLAIGKMVGNALKAVDSLDGVSLEVWDVRSCQPLDPNMISAAAAADVVVTIEDGIVEGGIGAAIAQSISARAGHGPRVVNLGVPTRFLAHAKPDAILATLGLDAAGIAATIGDLARG